MSFRVGALSVALVLGLAACDSASEPEFEVQGSQLNINGEITGRFVDALEAQLTQTPGIDTLVLINVPGSADDQETLIRLTTLIQRHGLSTVVPADGLVASGGTDMVLMGKTRNIEPGACIGVHTWGAEDSVTGAGLPKDAEEHDLYIDFYEMVDIPIAFYWFTLQAAGPDGIYWMSAEEINRFGMTTTPASGLAGETDAARKERCDAQP